MKTGVAAATLAVVLTSCSLKKITVDQTADILADAGRAFDTETDVELAAAAIPASLKTLEGFLQAHPEQPILLRLLADGYMSYGFGFLEDEAESVQSADFGRSEALRRRAQALYLRSRGFGLRLLALDAPEVAEALAAGRAPTPEQLAALGEDELPGLFWTANPWGAAINVGKSDPALVAELDIVRALMQRCAEIDERYYWAGSRLTLGALAAGLPVALGGKPDRAKVEFERAVELTGGKHLMTRVLYAKSVGVQLGDRAFFEKSMRDIIAADPDAEPTLALANRLAQRRAARYLGQIDEMFE
jgi:hypothetical protein